jgi:predicted permease
MNWWWRRNRELDEEIEAHLEMAKRERMERGESPESAERAARREFGNRTLVKEVTREVWGWRSLERVWQDLRYALRMIRRNPGFTSVAVLSLALGIGANTAIFSLINTVMLRLLLVEQPERLVELLAKYPGQDHWNNFSLPDYRYLREHNQTLSGLMGSAQFFNRSSVRIEGREAESVASGFVTGNFFPLLGVRPAIGRLIGPEDEEGGKAAVISWSYWKSRFDLDPAVLGKRLEVEKNLVTIVGVTAPGFSGLQKGFDQDIWVSARMGRDAVSLIGRLKSGVTIEKARAEMAVLYQRTIDEAAKTNDDPHLRNWTLDVEPAGAGFSHVRDRFGKPLLLLMGVVALLLLIGCSSVANMLLARAAAREREMALRTSLGASRLRLLCQVLTESLLLSAAAGLLGIFLAYLGTATLVRIIASGPDQLELHSGPDVRVMMFTALVAVLTSLLFGLPPALRAARPPTRYGNAKSQRLFEKGLVVFEVALSLVLLSAASLFVNHLSDLEHLDLGFARDHLLVMQLDPAESGLNGERLSGAYRELLASLEAIPGVRSATFSAMTPISHVGARGPVTIEGYQFKPGERRVVAKNWVAPKYFETFGVPLLAGRDFNFDESRFRTAIINRKMARSYFGNGNPIGKHLLFDGDNRPYEIVGVVGDAMYGELGDLPYTVFLNAFQNWHGWSQFAVRTAIAPHAMIPAVRRTMRESLKTVPMSGIQTMEEHVDATIVPERLIAMLSGLFGALGSLLAALGLYGLLAYTVARRVNEIGIRMALGATRSHVIRIVLGDAIGMVSAGLIIGIPIVLWSKRLAAGLIAGLTADRAIPIAFGAVAMLAIALLAAYLPARRAARVDPMDALRHE